jgi:uncharacterized protein YndB with AHSA1/START domain
MNDGRCEVEIDIRATPFELWDAITDPEKTRQYWHHALNRSTWAPRARWTSESAEGEIYIDGEIVEANPPTRLVHTFHFATGTGVHESPSTVAWDITSRGDACLLRLVHSNLGPDALASVTSGAGWEHILAGLKTLLETGSPLEVGAAGNM